MHHAAVSNAIVTLERETPSGPMKSRPNMAPHPRREATVFNEWRSIKQTRVRPRQIKGIRDPRVTHTANVPTHHATIPKVDTACPADAVHTAGTAAIVPHLTVTGLVITTQRPGNSRWTPNQDQHNQLQYSLPHRRCQN